MRLQDKIAIVTGGGQGFGEGIVERFAEEGCKVVVNDLNAETAERVAKAVTAKGGKAAAVQGDVSKDADWAKIVKFALDTFGGLNIVVNNAGTTHRNQSMVTVTEQDFDRVFNVNVKSIYHSAKHCVPYFRQKGGGVFVNIASTAGVRPRPGIAVCRGKGRGDSLRASAAAFRPAINPVAIDST